MEPRTETDYLALRVVGIILLGLALVFALIAGGRANGALFLILPTAGAGIMLTAKGFSRDR